MNRYSLWKYILIAVAILLGVLYTIPNYFPEAPALQISSGKATAKIESSMIARVEEALKTAGFKSDGVSYELNGNLGSVRARFADTDTQFKAKTVLEDALNPTELSAKPEDRTYLVAFNLVTTAPKWMQSLRALPMSLGLDLRGGVHFLMQVDTKALLNKKIQGMQSSVRTVLRDKNVRHAGISLNGNAVEIKFRDVDMRLKASDVLTSQFPDIDVIAAADAAEFKLLLSLKPASL
ncbi:MAG: protein translocase subunit SecD, partial [Pseudomonadota bacterium]